jgi:hypothetical protein
VFLFFSSRFIKNLIFHFFSGNLINGHINPGKTAINNVITSKEYFDLEKILQKYESEIRNHIGVFYAFNYQNDLDLKINHPVFIASAAA